MAEQIVREDTDNEGEDHPVIALALDTPMDRSEARTPVVWWGPNDAWWDGFYPPKPDEGMPIIGMLWFPQEKDSVEQKLRTLWLVDPESPEAA